MLHLCHENKIEAIARKLCGRSTYVPDGATRVRPRDGEYVSLYSLVSGSPPPVPCRKLLSCCCPSIRPGTETAAQLRAKAPRLRPCNVASDAEAAAGLLVKRPASVLKPADDTSNGEFKDDRSEDKLMMLCAYE